MKSVKWKDRHFQENYKHKILRECLSDYALVDIVISSGLQQAVMYEDFSGLMSMSDVLYKCLFSYSKIQY